jgi:hypothetical protein
VAAASYNERKKRCIFKEKEQWMLYEKSKCDGENMEFLCLDEEDES